MRYDGAKLQTTGVKANEQLQVVEELIMNETEEDILQPEAGNVKIETTREPSSDDQTGSGETAVHRYTTRAHRPLLILFTHYFQA